MKKQSMGKHIGYWFDRMMSKGPVAMSILLFVVMALIVLFIGVAGFLVSKEGSILHQTWSSLMYTLDAGNLADVPTDNLMYLFLMSLATLCGLFLTSILIGIIATGVEGKLRNLRKGTSVVQEANHTVIIGFSNEVFTLLRELTEANANQKKACIVVLGQQPKEEMEDAVASHFPGKQTTRIICRSGKLYEPFALERCSVETSKSVIVNCHDDPETIKILLALSAYFKDKKPLNKDLRFVVSLQDKQYLEAARIAGEGRAEIIYAKDAIARIIANTCRQHGLSQVLTELFNFSGDELYFESVPALCGKTFHEAVLSFSNAVAIGLYSGGQARLNPPMDTVIGKGDQVILLEADNGDYQWHAPKTVNEAMPFPQTGASALAKDHLVVLGSNEKLPTILTEYAKFMQPGTRVLIVDDDLDKSALGPFENLEINVWNEKVTRDLLCKLLLDKKANNILLLNDNSHEPQLSDSQTLLRLILLRDIADKTHRHFSITTEMRSVDNQRLASQARVDDFVIGSNFAGLLMAQLSENPYLMPLIDELLDDRGSELYMKPAAEYAPIGVAVDSYFLTESAARKGEIYMGYRHLGNAKANVVVNPMKGEKIVFGEKDQLVVIAEN